MLPSRRIMCCAISLFAMPMAASASPDQASVPASARISKQEAILGGPSRLQMVAMRQSVPLSTTAGFDIGASRAEQPKAEPASPDRPDLFGTVALAVGQTPFDERWRNAQAAPTRGFQGLLAGLQARDPLDQAGEVNRRVNAAIRFADDSAVYGVGDRWASASESLKLARGDCEDYAIAKLQLLRRLGFDPDDLYLTIVKDLVKRADHAVLVARIDGRFVVLDNNSDRLLDASEVSDYRPIFTFAAGKSWIHGYRRETQYAGLASGLGDAAR